MDRSCDDCRAWTELINLLKENFDEQYYKFFALDIHQNEGEELIKKIEVSANRYRHLNNEINNNLRQINMIEKQKERIISKKRKIEKIEIETLELKKENYRNKVSLI